MLTYHQDTATPMRARDRAMLVTIMALALALRLLWLGAYDYNYDEALELIKAQHLPAVLTQGMMLDTHTPLFPLLVAAWAKLGLAANEWTARLLPVALGMASIAAAFFVVRRWFGARAALWTAFLLAITPLHVILSRELKDQILMVLACTLAVHGLAKSAVSDRRSDWCAYAATAVFAAYTGFFAGPLLVAINGWFLAHARRNRRPWKRWALANAAAVACIVPLAVFSYAKSRALLVDASMWYLPKPTLMVCACFFKSLIFGYSDRFPLYVVASMLLLALTAVGCVVGYRGNRSATWLFAAWCLPPLAFVYIVSWRFQSIFLYRMLFVYALPVYAWAGLALAATRPRWARIATACAVVLCAAMPLRDMYREVYPAREFPHRPCHRASGEFKAAAEYIRANRAPDDLVLHSSHMPMAPFYVYGLDDMTQVNAAATPMDLDAFRRCFPPVAYPQDLRVFMEPVQDAVADRRRVWFVLSAWEPVFLGDNAASMKRWMTEHFTERQHRRFRQCEVFLFER